jgi:hypothetical protein
MIACYRERGTSILFLLVLAGCLFFGLSLAFPFCLPCDGSGHRSFIAFLWWFQGLDLAGFP